MKKYEIFEYSGIGYQKLFHFNQWRVAILNHISELNPEEITFFQAHLETDEAFVLLEGNAIIYLLNDTNQIDSIKLEKHKIYNIKKGVYHNHVLSIDAKLLIIEEENTSDDNSPKLILTKKQKEELIKNAKEHGYV